MVPELRTSYNEAFSKEKYASFLKNLNDVHPGELDFRVAETPIFVPYQFLQKMLGACEHIIDQVTEPSFISRSEKAIPPELRVPGESSYPDFIAFDFGICLGESGELEPQLIELQGFPSLFAYQVLLPETSRQMFPVPANYSYLLSGLNKEDYLKKLKEIIAGEEKEENVILLEIFPEKQKTRIDFFCTRQYLGIPVVCLTRLETEGRQVFYREGGKKIPVKRIYNRVIFDELMQQGEEVKQKGKIFFQDLDVTWVPHPNWFYRISKFTLPFLRHPFVPSTSFVNELKQVPADLENYVLKPLFSFAGQGVIIDVKPADLQTLEDPANWILQKKVNYAPVIETPDDPAKAEIRIFYFWEKGKPRPIPVNNLARLSKGKMVGVRYNKDKEWVGGSFCWFENNP